MMPYSNIEVMPKREMGWMAKEVAKGLEELFYERFLIDTIIEVGSWMGKSAIFMGACLKPIGGKLYAVDHWEGGDVLKKTNPGDLPDLYASF